MSIRSRPALVSTLVASTLVGATLVAPSPWSASLDAQAPFEGVVTMRLAMGAPQGGGGQQEVSFFIRGAQMRVNMAGAGGMAMLMMPAEKKMVMLMPPTNSYAEMTLPDGAAAAEQAKLPTDVKVTRTGKSETIAGYACDHVQVSAADASGVTRSTDACVSKALGGFATPMTAIAGVRQAPWQKALAAQGFPLRITGPDGQVALEVTKIEKKRLANTLFSIPDNYTKMAPGGRR